MLEYTMKQNLTPMMQQQLKELQDSQEICRKQILQKQEEISQIPSEVPDQTYQDGKSFGDITQSTKQPKQLGKCLALKETCLLEINRDLYLIKLKKINQEKLIKRSKFLRQISFMKNWPNKDIYEFNNNMQI